MDKFLPGVGPLNQPFAALHPMPDISRREGVLFFAVNEYDRVSIATSIERLIDLLDAMDDDPDDEYGGELEPSLGWRDTVSQFCYEQHQSSLDGIDRELDDADLEDGADDEWSLGWTQGQSETGFVACHHFEDCEEDRADHEPTLGAQEWHPEGTAKASQGDQTLWGKARIPLVIRREGLTDHPLFDECEDENEHGGDIIDVPHDGDTDDEPNLGWPAQEGQRGVGVEGWMSSDADNLVGQLGEFNGSGYASAKALLRGMPTLAGRLDALSMIAPVAYL
ncbi:MAG: hypothetical protein BGN83_16040 [Rhizobium sp. 63-7]|nr:MAG: hypothetical protein BGN83_16040 [Rhizobium sp. 63-7]